MLDSTRSNETFSVELYVREGSRLHFSGGNYRGLLETSYRTGGRETIENATMTLLEGQHDALIKITSRTRF